MIYKTEPSDFKKEIDVVGCYVEHDGNFLLLKRQPHKANGNTWGMPAGKVDPGESNIQTAARELREETGLKVAETDLKYFDSVYVRNEGHDLVYHMYSIGYDEKPEVQINPKEHQEYVWVTPEKAMSMELIHDLDGCLRLYYKI